MDSFVIIKKEKKIKELSIHDKEITLLKKYIESGKNVFLCGSAGYGKSFIINQVFDNCNSIEIWDDPLQKKDIFMDTIKNSNMYTYIEDYESDAYKYKYIVEDVSNGISITKKPLVVTSKSIHFVDNFTTIIIPRAKPEEIMKIKPNHANSSLAAKKCLGNIYNFFSYLDFPYDKDIFQTSKDQVVDILCNGHDINICDTFTEHGHMWSLIQENYIDCVDDNMDKITRALTLADLYDSELYKGDWDIMPLFILNAIKIPKMYFTKKMDMKNIRPGRFWTKFGNQRMREQKIRSIQARSMSTFNHQEFMLFRMYAQKGDISKFIEYNLIPQDFDVMNHLAIQNKLKQREVTKIKKLIKEQIIE